MNHKVDLNCDMGESFGTYTLGNDRVILDYVTSANIACGFHAGDASTLRRTCARAAQGGVVVGAQVGYRDLAGFGRRFVDMDPGELADDVVYQLGALDGMCRVAGTALRYLKPHGALYNAVVHHTDQARAVVRTIDLSAHEDVWDDHGRDREPVAVGAESIQVATRPDDPWAPNSSVRIRRWDA